MKYLECLECPELYINLKDDPSLTLVLRQCVYWSNHSLDKDGWFHKEYKAWFDEIFIPERTLRRYFKKLEQLGLITTKIKKVNGLNIKHIRSNKNRITLQDYP